MSERDQILLDALDDLQKQADEYGFCPATFYALRAEIMRIMGERDGYKYRIGVARRKLLKLLDDLEQIKRGTFVFPEEYAAPKE